MGQAVEGKKVTFCPTKPYIDKLIELVGVPEEGADISMSEIEAAINVPRTSSRWGTLIARWKEVMRNTYGRIVICKRGEGKYHFCLNDEKVDVAMSRKGRAERDIHRAMQILDTVDREYLSAERKSVYDNVRISMQQNMLLLAQSVK